MHPRHVAPTRLARAAAAGAAVALALVASEARAERIPVGAEIGVGSEFGRGLGLGGYVGDRHQVALGAGIGIYGDPRGLVPIRGGPGVTLGYRYDISGLYFGPSVGVHPHARLDTITTVQGDVGYRWRGEHLYLRAGIGLGLAADTLRPGELGAETLAPTGTLTLASGWRF